MVFSVFSYCICVARNRDANRHVPLCMTSISVAHTQLPKGGEERECRSHMTTDCPIGESVQVLMKYYILLYPLACFLGEGEGAEMLADLTREMALGLIGPTP